MYRPDLAVIVVGGKDVTDRVPVSDSQTFPREAVGALRPARQPLRTPAPFVHHPPPVTEGRETFALDPPEC